MKSIQLVTSTYNDLHKFSWRHLVDESKIDIIVYKKSDDLEIGQFRKDGEFVEIPNYGSCDYAFFYHIVNNYDSLSEYTIFTKMNLYDDYFRNFTEVFNLAEHYDFYQAGGAPVSQIWFNKDSIHLLDLQTKYTKNILNIDITKDKKPKHDGHSKWNGTEYEYAGNSDSQIDWYNLLYGNNIISDKEISTYQWGPCFSVSKRLIHRHPISVYRYFLEMFHPCNSWDYEVAKKYFNTDDENKQAFGIGRSYHDELLRFYRVMFTLGVDQNEYKINII